jgi:adenylate cyclase class 1
MNPDHDAQQNTSIPGNDDIAHRFNEYNAQKLEQLLHRHSPAMQKHIRALPLFFHVNQNLFPGHVNQHVPHGICGYAPDENTLHHAATFNHAFSYKPEEHTQASAIAAVYLQDNLKSGKLILWIIHSDELDTEAVELLRQKAARLNAWREARTLHLHCEITLPHTMAAAYWGEKYKSMTPDKSIFLDDFYSEAILLAGRPPAWWFTSPGAETQHEQDTEKSNNHDNTQLNDAIDFGAIANSRPQDYLATLLLNLLHVRNCPEETWLNILALCHKLAAWPKMDCTAQRIRQSVYAPSQQSGYADIYCNILNETIQTVYERDKTILIDRALKLLAQRHGTPNIYNLILAHRSISSGAQPDTRHDYEYTTAVDILHELIRLAVSWFVQKLRDMEPALLTAASDSDLLIQHLLQRIELKPGHIGIANLLPIRHTSNFDICLRHNIENRHNSWSMLIADSGFEIRQGKDPVELAAWGVFNRIISHNTRLSVSYPYLSIRQTHIADITQVLLQHLPDIEPGGFCMQTFITDATPVEDILIINETRTQHGESGNIHLYRFVRTSHDEIQFEQYVNMDGFLQLACKALGDDLRAGNKPHPFFMHSIGGVKSKTFISDARNVYNKICHFMYGTYRQYSHFIDVADSAQYAIARYNNTLTLHHHINLDHPEHFMHENEAMALYFSSDVDNHALLNFLYRNSSAGCVQLFYEIEHDTAQIYIIDEHGVLTRFNQPFHDVPHFLNQWLMFLYNSRHHIKTNTPASTALSTIDIYELGHNKFGQRIKTLLNASMLPMDDHYFDLKVQIQGDKGKQEILFCCEDKTFSSTQYGTEIYGALRQYLAQNFKAGAANPIYVSDVDIPASHLNAADTTAPHIRDYIKYKINIEKRLNAIMNRA